MIDNAQLDDRWGKICSNLQTFPHLNLKSFAFPAPTTAALPPIILAKLAALHGWPTEIESWIMITDTSKWQIMKRWLWTQICLPRSLRSPQDQEMPESKKEGLLRWSSLLVSAEIRWISATLCSLCDSSKMSRSLVWLWGHLTLASPGGIIIGLYFFASISCSKK